MRAHELADCDAVPLHLEVKDPTSPSYAELAEERATLEAELRSRGQLLELYGGELLDSVELLRTRHRLCAFYARHNPAKLEDVDRVLTKYRGKEAALIASLEKKYGASMHPDGLWAHDFALQCRALVDLNTVRTTVARRCAASRREAEKAADAAVAERCAAVRRESLLDASAARARRAAARAEQLKLSAAQRNSVRDAALAELRMAQRRQLVDEVETRDAYARRAWTLSEVAHVEQREADEAAAAAATADAAAARADVRAAALAERRGGGAHAERRRALAASEEEARDAAATLDAVCASAAYRVAAARAVVAAVHAVAAADCAASHAVQAARLAAKRAALDPVATAAALAARGALLARVESARAAAAEERDERRRCDEETVTVGLETQSLRALCTMMLESLWHESGAAATASRRKASIDTAALGMAALADAVTAFTASADAALSALGSTLAMGGEGADAAAAAASGEAGAGAGARPRASSSFQGQRLSGRKEPMTAVETIPSFDHLLRADGFVSACRAAVMECTAELYELGSSIESAERRVAVLAAQIEEHEAADTQQSRDLTAVADAKTQFEAKLVHIEGATGVAEEQLLGATAKRSQVEGELAAAHAELRLQHERVDALGAALITMRKTVKGLAITALRERLGGAERRNQRGEAMMMGYEDACGKQYELDLLEAVLSGERGGKKNHFGQGGEAGFAFAMEEGEMMGGREAARSRSSSRLMMGQGQSRSPSRSMGSGLLLMRDSPRSLQNSPAGARGEARSMMDPSALLVARSLDPWFDPESEAAAAGDRTEAEAKMRGGGSLSPQSKSTSRSPPRGRPVSNSAAYAAAFAEMTTSTREKQIVVDDEWARVALGYAPYLADASQQGGIGRPAVHSKNQQCGVGGGASGGDCSLS